MDRQRYKRPPQTPASMESRTEMNICYKSWIHEVMRLTDPLTLWPKKVAHINPFLPRPWL